MADLLGLGSDPQPKPNNLIEEVKELSELLGTTNTKAAAAASHGQLKFQNTHPEDFSPEQTVSLSKSVLSTTDCANGAQWKTLLPQSIKEGTLFSDNDFEITVQTQSIRYLVRLMLTFKSKDMLSQV